jgi:hypothetical protein
MNQASQNDSETDQYIHTCAINATIELKQEQMRESQQIILNSIVKRKKMTIGGREVSR